MKIKEIVAVMLCLLFSGVKAQSLTEKLDEFVSSSELLETSEVGISVYDLTAGKPVYTHQDKKLYRPASIEKIITTVTALARLGTGFKFQTGLAYTGTITRDSVLYGDLYVVGGFDPEFMEDDLGRFTKSVYNAGIRKVEGKLIGDVSLTDSIYWGPGWSWDDTPYSFQPYLSPLMLNRGCVTVCLTPAPKGEKPEVEIQPESDYYSVDNQAFSLEPDSGKLVVTRNWLSNGNRIVIKGNVSRKTSRTINMYSSKDFFLNTFAYQLRQQGIRVDSVSYGLCPEEKTTLYTIRRPLVPVLYRALKNSDNLAAESIFYQLGIERSKEPYSGTYESLGAICSFMENVIGKQFDDYKILDGSGVSLYNYISPELLMEYLKYAHAHPAIFKPFYDALPVAGVDGTLGGRMKKTKAFRNVRAKTGTVTGISSLAGYVTTANKHLLAFVIINQNVLKSKEARKFQDNICEILAK